MNFMTKKSVRLLLVEQVKRLMLMNTFLSPFIPLLQAPPFGKHNRCVSDKSNKLETLKLDDLEQTTLFHHYLPTKRRPA